RTVTEPLAFRARAPRQAQRARGVGQINSSGVLSTDSPPRVRSSPMPDTRNFARSSNRDTLSAQLNAFITPDVCGEVPVSNSLLAASSLLDFRSQSNASLYGRKARTGVPVRRGPCAVAVRVQRIGRRHHWPEFPVQDSRRSRTSGHRLRFRDLFGLAV